MAATTERDNAAQLRGRRLGGRDGVQTLRGEQPRHRRGARPRAALRRGRGRRCGARRPSGAARRGGPPRRSPGRGSCSRCGRGSTARSEDLARSVTTEMGKTIGDARAEVARMIEMVECACAIPTTMQGRILEDVATGRRLRDGPPAGRGVRGDRPVQLPGDGAVLVSAVRHRLRQRVHPQALRAGAADPADRLRGARRDRSAGRAWSGW